jgi:hypothetical protein
LRGGSDFAALVWIRVLDALARWVARRVARFRGAVASARKAVCGGCEAVAAACKAVWRALDALGARCGALEAHCGAVATIFAYGNLKMLWANVGKFRDN